MMNFCRWIDMIYLHPVSRTALNATLVGKPFCATPRFPLSLIFSLRFFCRHRHTYIIPAEARKENLEEVERFELPYARISDIRWFSGPVPYRSATLPNLAETPRFERGQPEGFGRLATCWFNRSPTLPYLVPTTGLEPARYSQTGLSRSCLPVPPHRQILVPQEGLEPPRRRRLFLRQVCLHSTSGAHLHKLGEHGENRTPVDGFAGHRMTTLLRALGARERCRTDPLRFLKSSPLPTWATRAKLKRPPGFL